MSVLKAIPDRLEATKHELASEVLLSSGRLRLRATGHSMLPTVRPGDTLIIEAAHIERAHGDEISTGDIAVFNSGRRFVAHRVVATAAGIGERKIQTQGDAVPLPDSPVSERELLGKVSFILRNGREIEPSRRLRLSQRAVAALLRCSGIAGRVVVGVHGFGRAVMDRALQNLS